MESRPRFAYLDNLRAFVIFLVVVMHSNVTYSGFGSWYYKEGSPDHLSPLSTLFFALYGSFTQAWFMGLLFMLGGYFAARSLARHGGAAFVRERLFRLGVPLLAFMLVLQPLIVYFLWDFGKVMREMSFPRFYAGYITSGRVIGGTGPLWFVEALLIFCLVYLAVRTLFRRNPASGRESAPSRWPGSLVIVGLIVLTGLAAFLIRLVQPIGADVANLQLCFFASYVTLFILGVHSGERGWLTELPRKSGLRWLIAGLAVGIPTWLVVMVAGGATHGSTLFTGGPHWQSLAYALWESFVALSLSIGLIVFFRTYLDRENRLLARTSFGIYMFHPPVLIGLSLALAGWAAPLLGKHLLVAPVAWLASLLLALVLTRTPLVKEIIK